MFVKIIGILVVVFLAVYIVSKLGGDEDAGGTAAGATMGCGMILLQLVIAGLSIMFILWLFS